MRFCWSGAVHDGGSEPRLLANAAGCEFSGIIHVCDAEGSYTPTRMLQRVTNTTSYLQGMLERTLGDLVRRVCLVYVDDVILFGSRTYGRLSLYARQVKWYGKLYFGTGVRHDPERIRELVEMRCPETVGELMQFLQAANWMRLSLPNMVEVVSPLRVLLERKLKGTTRTSVPHDPERVRGLVEMRCPETVGELMQFLQAANWIRLSLPNMAEVVSPLKVLLERKLKGTTRTGVRHDPERVRGLVEMRSPETVG